MRMAMRLVATAVMVALAFAGPLAPMATAQQQPPAQPGPPPAQTPQPDLFQESLKAQKASESHYGAYTAGAVVTNIFLVPGRAITCGLGGVVGVALLAATFGTGYRAASHVWHEGCGGKWIVTPDDLRPEPATVRPFDWERN